MRTVFRSLLTKPAYLIVSVLVLGVSIAAQLAIFAVINAVLWSPPSARAPGELAFVRSSLPGGRVSYPDYKDIQERSTSFTSSFAYYLASRTALTVNGDLVQVRCGIATGTFFPTLDIAAAEGRVLGSGDDVENAAPVVMISDELRRRQQIAVGSLVKINTTAFTVVGILPRGFRGVERATGVDVWIPTAQLGAVGLKWVATNRGSQGQTMAGRLKPGVTLAEASAELAVIAQTLHRDHASVNHGMSLLAESHAAFRYALDGSARLMVMLGALVWVLFALAFTNFFALTLLRLLARRREIAVRVAMGATRAHLGLWLLGELGAVALLSLGAGAGGGWALLRLLQLDAQVKVFAESTGVALESSTLAWVVAAVCVCALTVWGLSLRYAGRVEVLSAMKEQATAPRRNAAFTTLFAAQIAIALFLVTTAVAFVGALREVTSRSYPFRTENGLLFEVNFRSLGVEPTERVVAANKFLARLRAVPDVTAAGASGHAVLGRAGWTNVVVRGNEPSLEADKGFANWTVVTDGYFDAAGIRFREGRAIEAREILAKTKVAVINTAMARRYWPAGNALGQAFKPWASGEPHTIVGIIEDVPVDSGATVLPQVYLPWGQSSPTALVFALAVTRDSAALRVAITESLRDVWPHRTPPAIRSVREQVTEDSAELTTAVRVILWLAGFATFVTSCGLYFFSAYTAAQTVRDSAIRQALGAGRGNLLRAHLARYRLGAVAGAVLGVGLTLASRRALEAVGIAGAPVGVGTLMVAAAVLATIALIGLCLPLRALGRADLTSTLNQGG